MMQQGAYRQLIDEYMVHGPLPNDLQRLYRVCSAFSTEERAAVEYVLAEFFRLDGPVWRHKRCDREHEWQESKSEASIKANQIRWESERNPNGKRRKSRRTPNQNQNQNQNHIPEPKSEALASSPAGVSADDVVVIAIPLNDNTEHPIGKKYLEELEKLYPDVDALQTLREIRGWNLSNPTKRKTKSGVLRHVNTWFARVQNA